MKKKVIEEIAELPSEAIEKTIEISATIVATVEKQPVVKHTNAYWKKLGPGITTGAAGDDPSGIATYSQTGSQFGFQLLWMAPFSFPLMATVQEMCARIGLVTGKGLAANIRLFLPRWVLYLCTTLLFVANSFNIGANLGALAAVTELVLPQTSFLVTILFFTVLLIGLQIFSSYQKLASILKYLTLILFCYVITAFIVRDINWTEVLRSTVIPSFDLTKEKIIMACAILGTTISPYLFFWQTSQEVEEKILKGQTTAQMRQDSLSKQEIKDIRIDVWSGMFFSNLIMFFIIVVTGAVLHAQGITNIETVADAASALRPLAGDGAYLLFALGVIGTGMLAIPVLAGSASYAISESFRWKEGLYNKLKDARSFYGIIVFAMLIGLGINFIGINPIDALIWTAVANGLISPILIAMIVIISSNKKIMGEWVNKPVVKILGWTIVFIMGATGSAAIWAILS